MPTTRMPESIRRTPKHLLARPGPLGRLSVLRVILFALALWACGRGGPSLIDSGVMPVTDRPAMPGGNFLGAGAIPDEYIVEIAPFGEREIVVDRPFVRPDHPHAFYLRPDDLVLGVVIGGEVVAFPHNIGWWHNVVNHNVGGRDLLVTFSTLSNSGMIFEGRDIDGSRRIFGDSGMIFNSNTILYDTRDEASFYPQMTGLCSEGPRAGDVLEQLPVTQTTWRFWQVLYPQTLVLSGLGEFTSVGRYTLYPYSVATGFTVDYREDTERLGLSDTPLLPENNPILSLFNSRDTVLGIRFGELAKAYPFPSMGESAVINDTLGGNLILVVYYGEESFAVPYNRFFEGRELNFDQVTSLHDGHPFMLKDRETGSIWNMKGECIDGIMRGSRLRQFPSVTAWWYVWCSFWSNTGIY